MQSGDKVWWKYETTRSWGFTQNVPALVIRSTKKRVLICTLKKIAGVWQRQEVFVKPEKLSIRTEAHADVDKLETSKCE